MNADKTLTVILDLGRELLRSGTEAWLVEEKLDQIIEDMKKENNELLDSFVKKIEKIR